MEENRNEGQVPEPLREWTVGEILVAQFLQHLRDPDSPPELIFQLNKLILICKQPFWKELSQSDVHDGQDRLLIPQREAVQHILRFLNANEIPDNVNPTSVYDANGNVYPLCFPIRIYDTDGNVYPLCFRRRNDAKHVITHREPEGTRWRHVCQAIGLNEGNSIKFWTLRHAETNQLSFVIQKI